MPRRIPSGTPTRSSRYVFPDADRRLLYGAGLLGIILLVVVGALYAVGARRVVSPGTLAQQHAHINAQCSLCHEAAQNVADVRCARCHDSSGMGRLTNTAHVLLGSGDATKADLAPDVACVQCHTDHRGQQFALRAVDDRECAACHRPSFPGFLQIAALTTFQRHPEFAVFKAQRTTGVGLLFNHVTHLKYSLGERRGLTDLAAINRISAADVQKSALDTCQRCHQPSADRRLFVPVSFDAGCAGTVCHTDNKGLLKDGTRDVTIAHILENVAGAPTPTTSDDGPTKAFSGLRHRDAWVLFNAAWIRSSVDPDGANADRASLRASIAWLEQPASSPQLTNTSLEDLERWKDVVAVEIADIRARIASVAQAGDEISGLAKAGADAKNLVDQLSAALQRPASGNVDLEQDLKRLADGSGPGQSDADSGLQLDARRKELLALIASVRARALNVNDQSLVARADDLRKRVEQFQPSATPAQPDLASLRRQLSALDDVSRAARLAADPQGLSDAAALQVLREYARVSVLGGLSPSEFEQRRQEVIRLLDTLAQNGDQNVRSRAADLRARLLLVQPSGDDNLQRQLSDRRRLLDRIRFEIELMKSRDKVAPPPTPIDSGSVGMSDGLRVTLARLDSAASALAAPAEERTARQQTLNGLLAPCLKCHLYDGEDERKVNPISGKDIQGNGTRTVVDALTRSGLKLAAVTAAEPVMRRAVFTHAPHTTTANCSTCHGSLVDGVRVAEAGSAAPIPVGSTLAIELNSPGLKQCQTCHKPSGARTDCEACHLYHPKSADDLLRSLWSPN
jgi:hypothetical protein